ncbi:MAG: hypothetical protein RLZZ501_850 [Pseudomonadota bacterium]
MIGRIGQVNTAKTFGTLIKTVDRYSGEFADENLDRLATLAPFALVSHTASRMVTTSATGAQWDGTFVVVCGAVTKRTHTLTARIGGPSQRELGSRQMAELVRDLLQGQTLGLAIRALQPLSLDEVYSGVPGGGAGQHWLSVTGLQVGTLYSTTRSTVADGEIGALVALHAGWAPVTPDGETAPDSSTDVQLTGGGL